VEVIVDLALFKTMPVALRKMPSVTGNSVYAELLIPLILVATLETNKIKTTFVFLYER